MNWILILAIAVVSDALRIFVDNYISDVYFKERGAVSQKIISGIIVPTAGLAILVFTNFNFFSTPSDVKLITIASSTIETELVENSFAFVVVIVHTNKNIKSRTKPLYLCITSAIHRIAD